ncbi:hypothetical protein C8E87_1223 [Paractinoplanes brasiliensis]|uniref:Uncharacterized protein n=2 Tax=Paractinoplanes brasiliensis TaxID=52695 RepID=A0A4R6JP89_9ACTN|nr:hypothetical protein C8E87_1223 [Actinoplanes brasiliensis]GID31839.1 hypothetical protein Abr02nite_68220 [Actinoplanes brasiliensis]
MVSKGNLEERVAAVESEVVVLKQEMGEVRTLAAGASRDVGDFGEALRGHVSLLNALRATQLEQSAALKKQGAVLEMVLAVQEKQGAVQEKQGAVLEKHGAVLEKQGAVLEKVLAIQEKQGAVLDKMGTELVSMRESAFQQTIDLRTVRDAGSRHYLENKAAFATLKASIEQLLGRGDGQES